MPNTNLPSEIQINKYLTEEKTQILKLIDKYHRVLLQANPASGKTHFFKELANDIISGKRKGRLVFVAPFLIITKQFANTVNVDFALCGTSTRKKLVKNDKIITSTFQSLHHIANELKEDDIIVIDEAHALFYNYYKPSSDRQFYTKTIQDLYHTKAKVVLMSGTPNLSLLNMLRLHHIKIVKSTEMKAKININFSKSKNIDIAKEFAKNTINENGHNSLNIIYRKSIRECHNICDMLLNQGYNAKVLTSFEKNQSTYKSISDIEMVPNDIQFIVTTNVISTGANIQNTNVGSALILDEFNAAEIKQFSKRFRKKPDIEIDVVIKPFNSGTDNSLNLDKINNQREYLNASLKFHSDSLLNPNYNFELDPSYNIKGQELVTPKESIDRILDNYLRQESLNIDKAVDSIDCADDLADLLNEYDDIDAEVISDFTEINTTQIKKNDSSWDKKTKELIKNFRVNINEYITAMRSKHNQDWFSRVRIKELTLDELKTCVNYSQIVIDDIQSTIFLKEILPLFLKYRNRFKTTSDFLYYLENKKSQTQNILPLALLLNELLHQYFKVSKSTSLAKNNLCLQLIDKANFINLSPEVQFLLILIQETFDFCVFKDNLRIEDLRSHLEKNQDVIIAITKVKYFERIDEKMLNIKVKSFAFVNDNLVKALVQSVFYSETKRKGIKKVTSITFKDSLPSGHFNKKLNSSKHGVTTSTINGKETTIHFGAKTLGEYDIKYLNSYKLILEEFNKNL